MERKEKLVVVTRKDIIPDLRRKTYVSLVFPLKSFCVGYELEFSIEEIHDYVLVNRILTDDDLNTLDGILKTSHIKGIIFEDLGIIELVKDLNIEKILLLSHLSNSVKSINYYLDFVDSILVSTDITKDELKYITENAKKKVILYVFGPIPLMYSRRSLLTNYALYHNLDKSNELQATINDKYFHILENPFGTYFYTNKYFYLDDFATFNNILYYYYNPVFLNKKEILEVLDNNVNDIDTFNYLMESDVYYKLKEAKKDE